MLEMTFGTNNAAKTNVIKPVNPLIIKDQGTSMLSCSELLMFT